MTEATKSRCPACKKALSYDFVEIGKCIFCGYPESLHMLDTSWQGVDILAVSRRMRRLVIACLAFMVLIVIHGIQSKIPLLANIPIRYNGPNLQFGLAGIVYVFAVIPAAIHLQAAFDSSNALSYLANIVLLLMLPVSIIPIVWLFRRARAIMREAGLKPKLWGLPDEEIIRHFCSDRCQGCGYNLTGNTSGVCPECGKWLVSSTINS